MRAWPPRRTITLEVVPREAQRVGVRAGPGIDRSKQPDSGAMGGAIQASFSTDEVNIFGRLCCLILNHKITQQDSDTDYWECRRSRISSSPPLEECEGKQG